MESLRNNESVPIFEFWDRNIEMAEGIISNHADKKNIAIPEEIFFSGFFLGYLPLIGFEGFCRKMGSLL